MSRFRNPFAQVAIPVAGVTPWPMCATCQARGWQPTGHAAPQAHVPNLDGLWWDDAEATGSCVDAEIAVLVAALNAHGLTTTDSEARSSCPGTSTEEGYVAFRSPAAAETVYSWQRRALRPALSVRAFEGRGVTCDGRFSALDFHETAIPALTEAVLSRVGVTRDQLGVVPVEGAPAQMAWVGPRLLVRLYEPVHEMLHGVMASGRFGRLPAWARHHLYPAGERAIYRVLEHYRVLTEQDGLL